MINAIIEAISVALNGEFGDSYEIHMEEIEQGLEEPCFFIFCLNPTNDLFLGNGCMTVWSMSRWTVTANQSGVQR